MTVQRRRGRPPSDNDPRRRERAERILDAAAALVLRWGYDKTTLDDIARVAGVAKGTLYLHWKTREELFVALLFRERSGLAAEVKRRIAEQPDGATLHGMLRHSALALMERPLLKAALLRDTEVIGRLSEAAPASGAYAERLAAFQTYLEVLRDQGLVRTDQSLRSQVYLVGAIFAGFLLVTPLMPEDLRLADAELADLMAETVRRTLAPDTSVAPTLTAPAAAAVVAYLDRDSDIAEGMRDT